MSYFNFINKINKNEINIIFEVGSRDLIDAVKLNKYYNNSKVYAFECNPDCLIECNKLLSNLDEKTKNNVILINKAVSLVDDEITFYPFDLSKYNNMGASSLLKIDFSNRNTDDPDYNRENPQKEVKVNGVRLDTFMNENNIKNIDLLCMDLQGYELNALKSLGDKLRKVKYIITECSVQSTYINGSTFEEVNTFLSNFNFKYISSNKFGDKFPDLSLKGYSEFDCLFVNEDLIKIN